MRYVYGICNVAYFNTRADGDEDWYPTRSARDVQIANLRERAINHGLSESAARCGIYPIRRHVSSREVRRLALTTRREIAFWMARHAREHIDPRTGDVNMTSLVEQWDRDESTGDSTLDPEHIAWEIASDVAEEIEDETTRRQEHPYEELRQTHPRE